MTTNKLVLASASPRRYELLATLGVDFKCQPADIDESVQPGELPHDYVQRMAGEKATAVAVGQGPQDYAVLAADTIVVIDGHILGKPISHADGLATLRQLSGRSHTVTTALCLHTSHSVTQCYVDTTVQFVSLDLRHPSSDYR